MNKMHIRQLSVLALLASTACGPSYSPNNKSATDSSTPASTTSYAQPQEPRGLARTTVPPEEPALTTGSAPVRTANRTPPKNPPPAPIAVIPLTTKFQEILNTHNQHRADHCAAPLRWSQTLAVRAQKWADRLEQAGCAFEHSKNSPYGENLYFFAPAGSKSPQEVATGWYSEVALYEFRRGGFSMSTGHFSQLVWQGTTLLGCGVSTCNGGEIWVCNYDPPGNVTGYYQSHVLPTSCQ